MFRTVPSLVRSCCSVLYHRSVSLDSRSRHVTSFRGRKINIALRSIHTIAREALVLLGSEISRTTVVDPASDTLCRSFSTFGERSRWNLLTGFGVNHKNGAQRRCGIEFLCSGACAGNLRFTLPPSGQTIGHGVNISGKHFDYFSFPRRIVWESQISTVSILAFDSTWINRNRFQQSRFRLDEFIRDLYLQLCTRRGTRNKKYLWVRCDSCVALVRKN